MALKVDYVVRETTTNLRRNITLTIAAIVTIAVSLSLFGSAQLMRGGISNLSARWEDDVEIVVFLDREVAQEEGEAFEALQSTIEEHPEVSRVEYFDTEASREEFERLFERSSSMMGWLEENPDGLPTSFRIVPNEVDRDVIESMTEVFRAEAGVQQATSALEGVEAVERLSSSAERAILFAAIGLLIAAVLLILNAIRMAMYARRREIEVMKLVGATNWFIRVPFMMEGVVQGLVGSLLAVGSVKMVDGFMHRTGRMDPGEQEAILSGFVASQGTVRIVYITVVLMGVVIGALGSGIAISRFLRI